MKKKIFTLLIVLAAISTCAWADVEINSTNFPDANFREYVKKSCQKDGNNVLSADEIAKVKEISVTYKDISTLKGVEFFTALQVLKCTGNNGLTSLDLSKNVNMQELYCSRCGLTSLTVAAGAYNFKTIYCYQNQLRGDKMTAFLNSLPFLMMYAQTGQLFLIDGDDANEGNELIDLGWYTSLTSKGWYTLGYVFDQWYDYTSFLTLMIPSIAIDANKFPDANFQQAVKEKCDLNKDGFLSLAEVTKVKELFVYKKNIASLKGIEIFTELQTLSCYENSISSLDLSKNTKLNYLSCSDNKLTSLDLSKNTELNYLDCMFNQLTSLDLSKNTKLTELNCSNNRLNSLDLSKNTALEIVNSATNLLTSLIVSNNSKKLIKLDCSGNIIKSTEMGKLVNSLPKLEGSRGTFIPYSKTRDGNVITTSQVNVAKGKNWDVKARTGGGYEDYEGQPSGIAIDEKNFPDDTFRAYVKSSCQSDGDDVLTDDEIEKVKKIVVYDMDIANLKGIEFFTMLTTLYCSGNNLTSLDVSKNTKLTDLECNFNNLTSLDLSNNTALEKLRCRTNKLTSLNLSKNTKLNYLWCRENKLTSLDVSKNTNLEYLLCEYNELTSLNVSNNKKLIDLECQSNKINVTEMGKLVKSLPTVEGEPGFFLVLNFLQDENVITNSQVNIAVGKNWNVKAWNGSDLINYSGTPDGIEVNNREPITNNRYYSLDGHRLEGVPTQKGVYIRNGKKVVVK